MSSSLSTNIDALGRWRSEMDERVKLLQRFLTDQDLLDEPISRQIESLRGRLSNDKLIVAFVAEFSRGKSELINAIFFADVGRRILPATPGRTTMCPVELGYEIGEEAALALLPIETRLDNVSLTEWRQRPKAWKLIQLNPKDPEGLAMAMQSVTATRWVDKEEAVALGFWNDEKPDENPSVNEQGLVEIPCWRHAMINYPHPLLQRGLVIMDTPGLNAIGAEPELTLNLLPSAHAAVFILGADTGVTRSDLSVWREHLGPQSLNTFVALNKIDTLNDPLLTPTQIQEQVRRQCEQVAQTLNLNVQDVFPLSARLALQARIEQDAPGLVKSRLPELETALAQRLLPQRQRLLADATLEITRQLENSLQRQFNDRRRQVSDQISELRSLRGKNDSNVNLLLKRVENESSEFEQCIARLQALRVIHKRMLDEALDLISSDRVREAVEAMRASIKGSLLNLGAKRAFSELCATLQGSIERAQTQAQEIQGMLGAYFNRLNADFGFSLSLNPPPDLGPFSRDLDLIERNYEQYLGFTQSIRLSQPRFLEQFRRMLVSRLKVVFEGASNEVEEWNKVASSQVDTQLRERRKDFRKRRESLQRVQGAGAELELRIAELEAQQSQLLQSQARLKSLFSGVSRLAETPALSNVPLPERIDRPAKPLMSTPQPQRSLPSEPQPVAVSAHQPPDISAVIQSIDLNFTSPAKDPGIPTLADAQDLDFSVDILLDEPQTFEGVTTKKFAV